MQELDETGVKLEIGNVDKVLKFQKDTGYIFIQTDKPIYNPRQTGMGCIYNLVSPEHINF